MVDRVCEQCCVSIVGKNCDAKFCGRQCAERSRRKRNPEKFRAKEANQYKKHGEKRKAYARHYRARCAEQISERRRRMYAENPEPIRQEMRRKHNELRATCHFQEITQAAAAIIVEATQLEQPE